ncbi:hypothetical protein ZWY2020_012888 [Hordeum vulgare]|nr:hypothetical protein ZWY2020_012888 [Hordeum vulgare]
MAPEYAENGHASTCGDVYSFGIVLLEMLTGKRPTDDMFRNELTIVRFVEMNFPDHTLNFLDCRLMSQYITGGGVAEVYVEYFGEQDDESASHSGSDFENEMGNESEGGDVEPDAIITAEDDVHIISVDPSSLTVTENVVVPTESGLITQVISSPTEHNFYRKQRTGSSQVRVRSSQFQTQSSQVHIYSSQVVNPGTHSGNAAVQQTHEHEGDDNGSVVSDSEEDDSDYVAGSDDSGLEEEYVELREQAKAFKKRIRDSKRWAQRNSSGVVPIDLVANVEEVVTQQSLRTDNMVILLAFLLLMSYGAANIHSAAVSHGNRTDMLALLDFKGATNDPTGALRSWDRRVHYCHWKGVTCSSLKPGRVAFLELADERLSGEITPSLGNLTYLQVLDLSSNGFSGQLPSLNQLHELFVLDLGNNSFHRIILTQSQIVQT